MSFWTLFWWGLWPLLVAAAVLLADRPEPVVNERLVAQRPTQVVKDLHCLWRELSGTAVVRSDDAGSQPRP